MPKLDIKNPKRCPFRKSVIKRWDLVGPNYEPLIVEEIEQFEICMREECMFYRYYKTSDEDECILRKGI